MRLTPPQTEGQLHGSSTCLYSSSHEHYNMATDSWIHVNQCHKKRAARSVPGGNPLWFNVVQSLSVFYGRNRPDYYLTEGFPLLLTTALPFAVLGAWRSVYLYWYRSTDVGAGTGARNAAFLVSQNMLFTFTIVVGVMAGILSAISHKEVRFVYPLLPLLHVLAAGPMTGFFAPSERPGSPKNILLVIIVICDIALAAYSSLVHQRGVIDVLSMLRREYESKLAAGFSAGSLATTSAPQMTAAFLMPCHSTPWRSHIVYPGIKAWALTCEPPLGLSSDERATYRDEADHFYADPTSWLDANMRPVGSVAEPVDLSAARRGEVKRENGRRMWPEYLVFFAQLEPLMRDYLFETAYMECWRGFNSHWHDDDRRHGDVVVWCLR
ncbi:glycosylphosphatidylinositol anchor biosynthesis [Elasticomyces elasticus]|nr:glycosylphosphatidylinositol anchor biosynthesis [Elasticomyces elasticus]